VIDDLDICPNNCNGHGECQINKCLCHNNWFGSECQFTIENNCNDRLDNDNGLYYKSIEFNSILNII
jgi:hypothetical protein